MLNCSLLKSLLEISKRNKALTKPSEKVAFFLFITPLKTKIWLVYHTNLNTYLYRKPDMMNERSHSLKKIRPQISSAKITDNMSDDERFQNETLRPIIKLQNDLFLFVFQNYITKRKNTFYELTPQKRLDYIAHAIQKDLKFRNSLKGMVIGQFTVEEYEQYTRNSSALNKRMMNMVIKRIQDRVQFFEKVLLV